MRTNLEGWIAGYYKGQWLVSISGRLATVLPSAGLNLRTKPEVIPETKIGTLPQNTVVKILREERDEIKDIIWYYVTTNLVGSWLEQHKTSLITGLVAIGLGIVWIKGAK